MTLLPNLFSFMFHFSFAEFFFSQNIMWKKMNSSEGVDFEKVSVKTIIMCFIWVFR